MHAFASVRHATAAIGLLLGLTGLFAGTALAQQAAMDKSATTLPGPRYAWVAMPAQLPAEQDRRVQDPAFREHLQAALDKALQAKGYQPASGPSQADFFIAYRVGVQDVEEVLVKETPAPQTAPTPQAAIQCGAGGCSQLVTRGDAGQPVLKTSVRHGVEGGLLIEVLEPNSIRVLWRTLERAAVKRGDAKPARLDAIARQTLAGLPAAPR